MKTRGTIERTGFENLRVYQLAEDIADLVAARTFPSLRGDGTTPNCFAWAPRSCRVGDLTCAERQAEEARIMDACPRACIACAGAASIGEPKPAGWLDNHRRLLSNFVGAVRDIVK